MPMRLALTGRNGQLVTSLVERAAGRAGIEVCAIGRPELDLLCPDGIAKAIRAAQPNVIVSAAAYTAVDQAEKEPAVAFAVNAAGAGHVARVAKDLDIPVIHLSTDYVFDGDAGAPYDETAAPAPCGVYGASKLAGESAVAMANPRHVIVRTAWVYSPFGANFVKTMLRLAADRDEIAVVCDQWGNPTSALDLADAVLTAAQIVTASGFDAWGIYHLAGRGFASRSGFARHILACSREVEGPSATIRDVTSAEFPTPARRPLDARLDTRKGERVFGWTMPDWQVSTREVVERLLLRQK
jgi:dTDP-4-dehydrorhamnose reductase